MDVIGIIMAIAAGAAQVSRECPCAATFPLIGSTL